MPTIAVVNDFGKVQSSTNTWPEFDYPAKLGRWSVQDHVYYPEYTGPAFYMTLGSSRATVIKTSDPRIYFVEILGDTLPEVYNLSTLVNRKLGYEDVMVFPYFSFEPTTFWARLLWLIKGTLPNAKKARKETKQVELEVVKLKQVPTCDEEWVRFDNLAAVLETTVLQIWEQYFHIWENESGYVMIAGQIWDDFFMGGVDKTGGVMGNVMFETPQWFYEKLPKMFISVTDVKKMGLKQLK
jgi:hypothetical protein